MGERDWGQNSVRVMSVAVRITFRTQLTTVSTQKIAFNPHYTPDVISGSLNEDAGKSYFSPPLIILWDLLLQNMDKKKAYAEGPKSDSFFTLGISEAAAG